MQDRGPGSSSSDHTGSSELEEAESSELEENVVGNGNIPAPAWSDATLPTSDDSREEHRVPAKLVTVRADPSILPDVPRESRGLLELVSPIARRALEMGLLAREPSFHVFVAAEPEVMIEDDIVRYAARYARVRPAPPDIVYVHDFDHPEAPKPLLLPAGVGPTLVAAMDALVDKLQEEIPNIAHSDTVREAQVQLARELETRNKAVLTQLESTAKTLGFGIRALQGGVQTFPILHGKPLSPEQFAALDDSTKRALNEAEGRLTAEVEKAAALVRDESARHHQARDEAFSRAAEDLIRAGVQAVRAGFSDYEPVLAPYFDRVERALVEDWEDLVIDDGSEGPQEEEQSSNSGRDHDPEHATRLNRFSVNLLVANDPAAPPPVLYDTNPTYPNLFGYLERRARFGALLTDFTRVRAGSLHKASGGVLVVRAADLLADPIIWERMKRILRERQIGAEDPLGPLGLYATSLRPVPVPIDVRVVLVGPPHLYAALLEADADFAALFRVKVEVESTIPRTNQSLVLLDSYLMNMAKDRWGSFDRSARARLLDLATRLAGQQDKLSLLLSPLEETAAFASALAVARTLTTAAGVDSADGPISDGGADPDLRDSELPPVSLTMTPPSAVVVTVRDIEDAWRERRERAGSAERHIRELTLRGEVALETSGTRIGVVNGLSVFSAGDVEFGQPMRITAVVALGREGIIDVEREAQLGGAIHTKGVAILRGYLGRLFGQERPLSLRAQIAFEQSYGEIDGDSASSSELFAVLSALADVGIDQGVAVTGSVNQLGEIQAIGGVGAKIEGFFDLCAARGLTGTQGVLIPRSNLAHLVLRDDVALAIADGKFHLYGVRSVEEGIGILTGLDAGERDISGRFPAASVFGRVERRLIEIAERLREAEGHGHHDGHEVLEEHAGSDLSDGADFRRPRGLPKG
ncbi:Lon protease family protein [Pendulispora albinea]|uniref:endopeptidase La n=1 Tax=Pendulispora albinea TaxID=2741071 RepID=A0ABZ2LNE2_9BACT